MKYADISGQSQTELRKKKNEIRAQIFEAKMKNSMGQLQNPASIKNMKRDIAKIFTVLNAKAAAPKAKATAQPATAAKPKAKSKAKSK